MGFWLSPDWFKLMRFILGAVAGPAVMSRVVHYRLAPDWQQHVAMQRAFEFTERFSQSVQVAVVVFLGENTRFALMAALHEHGRQGSRKKRAWAL